MAHLARFQGADRINDRLRQIPTALDIKITPAMAGQADKLVAAMKARAPENKWPSQYEPWQKPGTLRHSIKWKWIGHDKIRVSAQPPTMFNLGLWTEGGTQGRPKGRYRGDRPRGKIGWMRKNKRAHTATKAQPFFVPVWRALKAGIVGAIKASAKAGLGK